MKQLLQCYNNVATILAFHERLFVYFTNNDAVVELVLPPPVDAFVLEGKQNKNNKPQKHQQQQEQQQQQPPPPPSNPIQAVAIVAEKEEEEGDDDEVKAEEEAPAVFWCAVSRADKSLLLYRIQNNSKNHNDSDDDTEENNNNNKAMKIQTIESPTTIYNTTKRVGCMCFARVPHKSNDKEGGGRKGGGMLVLLTGDYTGDALAWPLQQERKKKDKEEEEEETTTTTTTKKLKADSEAEASSSSCSRLLLGHTASMLTGIRYDPINNVILTSDRDEKIRVSCFPQTAIIKGFLLGHEAYVSCMDVHINKKSSLCVTCSGGDETIRVWDYNNSTMKELVSWSSSTNNNNNNNSKNQSTEHPQNNNINSKENDDDDDKVEETKDDDEDATTENDENNNVNNKIPTRVAIDAKGQYIAVIYDHHKTLDILKLQEEENGTKKSLHLTQSIDCPDQPLNICFTTAAAAPDDGDDNKNINSSSLLMVLLKDSTYLQVYQQRQQKKDDDDGDSSSTPLCYCYESIDLPPGLASLQKFARNNKILIPESIIEKDREGLPTMQKIVEKKGAAMAAEEDKPWNKTERIEIAKERNKRHRKHRAERKRKERQQQQQQEEQQQGEDEGIQKKQKKQKLNGEET